VVRPGTSSAAADLSGRGQLATVRSTTGNLVGNRTYPHWYPVSLGASMRAFRPNRARARARLITVAVAVAVALPIVPATVAASGLFAPYQAYPVGSWPEAVAIGDVTGDGRNDVVMTTSFYFDEPNDYRLWVFAQTADGNLAAPVSYPTASTYMDRAASVAIGDVTGDGLADVLLGLGSLGVELFPQLSSGELGSSNLTPTVDGDRIRLGHLDGDADLDVAGVGWGSNTVTVLLNDGAGGFGGAAAYPAQHAGYDDLEVADVTNDGLDDLVVMSGQAYAVPNISVVPQLAGGGFGPAAEYRVGTNINTNGIGVGDVNGDGRTDIVASYGGNTPTAWIARFAGTETGGLEDPYSFSSYDIPESIDVADFDLDGDADIVTLHGGWSQAGIYRQQPGGSMGYEELYSIPYASHYEPHGLAVGDISGDGSPDIAIADYNHGLVVLRNNLPNPPTPTTPSAPTLNSASRGNNRVTLFWSEPSFDGYAPITAYNVYRGTASGGETLLTTVGSVTNFADTTAVNGTTYFYQVSAVNSAGEGPRSAELSATPATTPGAPTLVSATAGDTSVGLSWSAPASDGGSAITSYTATASPGGAICTSTGTACTVTGLTNGTSYAFTVRARNAVGTGPASNALSATPRVPGDPPSAPLNPATSPNQPEGILVSWSAPSSSGTHPITAYRIYRGTSPGSATYLATVGNVASYMDAAVTNGGLYYYQVAAVNAPGEGPRSVERSAQRGTAPSAPRSLTASTNKPGGVSLKWSAPSSNGGSAITGYRIYRGTSSGSETYLVSVSSTTTSYADRSTTKGLRYYYWVTAVNVLGVGPASNEANAVAK
jgi:fibronectin type 3 domain-containing protein